jgi:hypothetical protein
MRNVVRRLACKAHGIERSQDEIAQQTRIRLRRKNASALGVNDKLRPSGNVGSPKFASGSAR